MILDNEQRSDGFNANTWSLVIRFAFDKRIGHLPLAPTGGS